MTLEEYVIRGVQVRVAAVTHEGTYADPVTRTLVSWHAHFDDSVWGETAELRHPIFPEDWEASLWRLYGTAIVAIEAARGVKRGASAAVVDAAVAWASLLDLHVPCNETTDILFDAVTEAREKGG